MFSRTLSPPRGAFFLFGPRGTGAAMTAIEVKAGPRVLPLDTFLRRLHGGDIIG